MLKFGAKYLMYHSYNGTTLLQATQVVRKVREIVQESLGTASVYQTTKLVEQAAELVSDTLGMHGVEWLETKKGAYYYVNAGDTYYPTVIFPVWEVNGTKRKYPFVSSWGELEEAEGRQE